MASTETRGRTAWPDAMQRWLPGGPAEPGTAAMPSLALLAFGARPALSMSSHADEMPEASAAVIRNHST